MLKTVSSITNAIGALNYKGTWDANANNPVLASGVGTKGDYYVVSVAGTTNLNGISNWGVGDWAAFNGSVWQRVEGGADLNGVNLSVSGTTTLSGLTPSTALYLNAQKEIVSGTLPTTIGGTGLTSFTANGIVYASSASALATSSSLGFDSSSNLLLGTTVNGSASNSLIVGMNTTLAPPSGVIGRFKGSLEINTLSTANTGEIESIYFKKSHTAGINIANYDLAVLTAYTGNGFDGGLNIYTGKAVGGGNYAATLAMKINEVQGVQTANCVSVGGVTPSTSGAGITFPATQSASTDANTLDDYEEGTWTVGIAFGGGSTGVTYSGQQGTYTKVGRQVTCVGVFALTSKGSSTGSATITGLPFTVAANEPNYGGVAFGYNYQVSFADMLYGRTIAGGTTIALTETTNAGVDTNITDADFTNASVLRFTLTYFV